MAGAFTHRLGVFGGGAGGGPGGGGVSFGSHSYWKLVSRNPNFAGGYTNLNTLNWLDTTGTPISTSGATHSGSAVQAGSFANLYDGNTSTFYQTSVLNDAEIQIQFAVPAEVSGVSMSTDEVSRAPYFFDIYFSDNGSSWTYAFSGHYSTWSVNTLVTFMSPATTGAMAYWAAVFSAGNGSAALTLSEMELRTSVGGSDQATGGTPFRSTGSDYGFGDVVNLFDDNTGTYTTQFSFYPWSMWGYQLSTPLDIVQVGLRARSSFLEQSPTAGTIIAGSDGRTFVRRADFSGLSWPSDLYLNLITI